MTFIEWAPVFVSGMVAGASIVSLATSYVDHRARRRVPS